MYKYLRVESHRGQKSLIVAGTDAETIEWIREEVKLVYEKASASSRQRNNKLTYGITLRVKGNNEDSAAIWILDELMKRGWEPFAVDGQFVHLRHNSE